MVNIYDSKETDFIHITARMNALCKDNIYDYQVIYGEISFKASSWDKQRRVVINGQAILCKIINHFDY